MSTDVLYLFGKVCPVALLKDSGGETRYYVEPTQKLKQLLAPGLQDRISNVLSSKHGTLILYVAPLIAAVFFAAIYILWLVGLPEVYLRMMAAVLLVILVFLVSQTIYLVTQESKDLPMRLTYELSSLQSRILKAKANDLQLDPNTLTWKMLEAAVMDKIGDDIRYQTNALIALREILKPEKLSAGAKATVDAYAFVAQLTPNSLGEIARAAEVASVDLIAPIKAEVESIRQASLR